MSSYLIKNVSNWALSFCLMLFISKYKISFGENIRHSQKFALNSTKNGELLKSISSQNRIDHWQNWNVLFLAYKPTFFTNKFERSIKIHRGSYMSAHVLLNLLNELGKRDKMRGLPSILSLFRNEFNKFNNTRARMLDSIYHMTNTLKSHFWRKNVIILSLCTQRCYGRHNVSRKSINH